ncbi:hypothetical protein WICPIJ_009477 [Wickerhamomyces pijperi]|uniref:Uncharacterized protein n=1 Tax=Wickerhamomyces pijperi TaxID=599730 RepID=A0A9P8PNJ4_WICPI|nr:hypothetical protein WICPIJ_009477 [Wickerhamomyces pijperi]
MTVCLFGLSTFLVCVGVCDSVETEDLAGVWSSLSLVLGVEEFEEALLVAGSCSSTENPRPSPIERSSLSGSFLTTLAILSAVFLSGTFFFVATVAGVLFDLRLPFEEVVFLVDVEVRRLGGLESKSESSGSSDSSELEISSISSSDSSDSMILPLD